MTLHDRTSTARVYPQFNRVGFSSSSDAEATIINNCREKNADGEGGT